MIKNRPENRNRKKELPVNKKIILFSFMILTFFLTELFAYAWCRVQCIKIGYEISDANDKQNQSLALQEKLKIELERLKSPNRITHIAKTQLGLTMPREGQIIQLP